YGDARIFISIVRETAVSRWFYNNFDIKFFLYGNALLWGKGHSVIWWFFSFVDKANMQHSCGFVCKDKLPQQQFARGFMDKSIFYKELANNQDVITFLLCKMSP